MFAVSIAQWLFFRRESMRLWSLWSRCPCRGADARADYHSGAGYACRRAASWEQAGPGAQGVLRAKGFGRLHRLLRRCEIRPVVPRFQQVPVPRGQPLGCRRPEVSAVRIRDLQLRHGVLCAGVFGRRVRTGRIRAGAMLPSRKRAGQGRIRRRGDKLPGGQHKSQIPTVNNNKEDTMKLNKIFLIAALAAGAAARADTYQCVQCQNGTYASGSACKVCESGYYCVGGTRYSCPTGYNCPAGSAAPLLPLSSSGSGSSTANCTVKQYFNGASCVNCPTGRYSNGGQSRECSHSCPNIATCITKNGSTPCSIRIQSESLLTYAETVKCAACPMNYPLAHDGKCCGLIYTGSYDYKIHSCIDM